MVLQELRRTIESSCNKQILPKRIIEIELLRSTLQDGRVMSNRRICVVLIDWCGWQATLIWNYVT